MRLGVVEGGEDLDLKKASSLFLSGNIVFSCVNVIPLRRHVINEALK